MRQDFKNILNSVLQGLPAALELDIEGVRYLRKFCPQERLILLGGGHIAQPLCTFAAALGFSAVVVDDRPSFANRSRFPEANDVLCDAFPDAIRQLKMQDSDYVAVITRGHRWDADCLRAIVPGPMPKYLGMIGSKRRTTALLQLLEEEGLPREKLCLIHTPIGLNIGALTIQEIAISIVAELIQCRRQGTSRHTKGTVMTSEDIDLALLKFLAEDETPKALLLVYDSSGSTPVKPGAMMAVNNNFQTAGTIGGGCSENAVLRDAYAMIGSSGRRTVAIDMSNDVAEEEGMVCGGGMKVLIVDVTQ